MSSNVLFIADVAKNGHIDLQNFDEDCGSVKICKHSYLQGAVVTQWLR